MLALLGLALLARCGWTGSFMTKKHEPEDVDIVLYAPVEFFEGTQEQQDFLNWLADDRDTVRNLFSCHTAAIAVYPEDRAMYPLYMATRNGYADAFGHSVITREPKGIASVILAQAKAKGKGGA